MRRAVQELEKINTLDEKIAMELVSIQDKVDNMNKGEAPGRHVMPLGGPSNYTKRPSDILNFALHRASNNESSLAPCRKVPRIVGWRLTPLCPLSVCAEMVDFEDIEGLRSRAGEKKSCPCLYRTTEALVPTTRRHTLVVGLRSAIHSGCC